MIQTFWYPPFRNRLNFFLKSHCFFLISCNIIISLQTPLWDYGWMWPAELDHFTRPQPFFISAPRSDLGWEVKLKTAAIPHSTKTGDQRCLTILRDRNLLERQPGCLSMAFLSTCGRVRRLSARFFSSHFFAIVPSKAPSATDKTIKIMS